MGDREMAVAAAVRGGVPVLLVGPPGTGKSSWVRALGAAWGWHVETVIASIRDRTDFGGFPRSNGDLQFVPLAWARRLAEDRDSILFMDEVNAAPPSVQAALLRVVLERVVGDTALSPRCRMLAAMNPVEQAASGILLSAAMSNRWCHVGWELDAEAWAEGLVGRRWPAPTIPAVSDEEIAAARTTADARVAAYARRNPGAVLDVPRDDEAAGRAWPSPRSWTMVADALAAADAMRLPPGARRILVEGCVGEAAALGYLTWEAQLDLPDPEAILADPAGCALDLERTDRLHVTAHAVAGAVVARGGVERWQAAWRWLGRVADGGCKDVAVLAGVQLCAPGVMPPGARAPEMARLLPLLQAAGLAGGGRDGRRR